MNIPARARATVVAIEERDLRIRIRLDDGMECSSPEHYLDPVPPLEQLAAVAL